MSVPQSCLCSQSYINKCKNIFTKMLKDVGIEVAKSNLTNPGASLHIGYPGIGKVADLEFVGFGRRYEDFVHQGSCTLLYK